MDSRSTARLIAHEMRHALEVLGHPEVVDVPTFEALYRRIGTPMTGQIRGYETSGARAAGDAVLTELLVPRIAHVRSSARGLHGSSRLP